MLEAGGRRTEEQGPSSGRQGTRHREQKTKDRGEEAKARGWSEAEGWKVTDRGVDVEPHSCVRGHVRI